MHLGHGIGRDAYKNSAKGLSVTITQSDIDLLAIDHAEPTADAELTAKMYGHAPVMIEESKGPIRLASFESNEEASARVRPDRG